MTWWSRFWRRDKAEQDLGRELAFHIEERVSALQSAGLSEADARRQVRHEFGGMEQVKEACRDARGMSLLDDLGRDLRGIRFACCARAPCSRVWRLVRLRLELGRIPQSSASSTLCCYVLCQCLIQTVW